MADPKQQNDQAEEEKKYLRYFFYLFSCVTTGIVGVSAIYTIVSTAYQSPKGGSGKDGSSGEYQDCIEDCLEQFGITSGVTGPCKYDGKGVNGIPKGKIDPIVKYLSSKGYNKIAISGIIGNWIQESGLEPNNCENRSDCEGIYGDNESCAYKNPNINDRDQCGYGLAQWTFGSRKDRMTGYQEENGGSLSDLNFQLNFFNYEADNFYSDLKPTINASSNPTEASQDFQRIFEGAGNPQQSNRDRDAEAVYKEITCDESGTTQPIQEGEEEPAEETEEATEDSSFSGQHIISGVPYFNQTDWKPNLPTDGCGITSGSMLSLFYVGKTENEKREEKEQVNPNNFLDNPGYVIQPGIKRFTGLDSIDVVMGSTAIDTYISGITKLIDQQIPIIIFTGYNLKEQVAANLYPYGHIMVVTGYIKDNNGKLSHMVVNDPSHNYYTGNKDGQNAEYPIADFKKYLTETQHDEGTHYYYINKPGNNGFTPSSVPGDYDPSMTPQEYCEKKCSHLLSGGVYDEECVKLVLEIANDPFKYGIADSTTDGSEIDIDPSCCAGFASRVLSKAKELGAKIHPSFVYTNRVPAFVDNCPADDPKGNKWDITSTCDSEGKNMGIKITNKEDLKPGDLVIYHNPNSNQDGYTFTHVTILAEDGKSLYDCSINDYRNKELTVNYSQYFAEGRRFCLSGGGGGGPTGDLKDECKNVDPCVEEYLSEGSFDHIYLHWTGGNFGYEWTDTIESAVDFSAPNWGSAKKQSFTRGYHFVIMTNGTLHCVHKTSETTAHTVNRNKNSLSISLDGAYPNSTQIDLMSKLVAIAAQKYGINIDSTHVMSHSEAASLKDFSKEAAANSLCSTTDETDAVTFYKDDKAAYDKYGVPHCNYGQSIWPDGWPGGNSVRTDITTNDGHNWADDVRAKALQCFTEPKPETLTEDGTTPSDQPDSNLDANPPGTTTGQ